LITKVHLDRWFRAELEPRMKLARIARTAEPFVDLAECERAHATLAGLPWPDPRSTLVLLHDLRQAPSRNDPDFEAVVIRHAPQIFSGFRRVAVLVKNLTGKLQVDRLARAPDSAPPSSRQQGRATPQVFTEESAAIGYLIA